MKGMVVLYRGALAAEMAWIEPGVGSDSIARFYTVHGIDVLSLPHGPRYFGFAELADLAPAIFADWRQPCDACDHAHAIDEACDVETGGLADDRPGRGGLRVTFFCGCTGEGPAPRDPDQDDDPDDEAAAAARFVETAHAVSAVVAASYDAERGSR